MREEDILVERERQGGRENDFLLMQTISVMHEVCYS